jgi:hypothetical protein
MSSFFAGEFRGAIQAVRGVVQREGYRGLFAGYRSFLLRDLPFDAIEFVAYEQLKRSYKVGIACLWCRTFSSSLNDRGMNGVTMPAWQVWRGP